MNKSLKRSSKREGTLTMKQYPLIHYIKKYKYIMKKYNSYTKNENAEI